jgi:1-acyl-sn-glycerol-3-phosphate acyltransferase
MIRPAKVHVVIGEPITVEVGESGRAPRRAISEASGQLSVELQRLFDLAEARVG